MPAPKGNKFWEARSSHGRKPIFASPEQLWNAAIEYFDWCEENPLWEARLVSHQGESHIEYLPKLRAMTIGGLCLFLDITTETWREYCIKEGFSSVTKNISETIRTQKFVGAAADQLNANIIARDLGLADKKELTGEDGGPIKTEDVSITEVARRMAFVLASAAQELDDAADEERQKDHDRYDS